MTIATLSISAVGCLVGNTGRNVQHGSTAQRPLPSQAASPLDEDSDSTIGRRANVIAPATEHTIARKQSTPGSAPYAARRNEAGVDADRFDNGSVSQASASDDNSVESKFAQPIGTNVPDDEPGDSEGSADETAERNLENDPNNAPSDDRIKPARKPADAESDAADAARTETAEKRDPGSDDGRRKPSEVQISSAPYNAGAAPWTVDDELPSDFRELSLDDVIEMGLQNATVLRSLGGQVLQNPQGTTSIYEPSLRVTDPILGEEAALSQFDAQLQSNMTYQNNDNVFNSATANGGQFDGSPFELQQDLFNWNFQLQKTTANGTQLSLNRLLSHDNNAAPQNAFSHAWTNALEATIRTPLLQGGGVEFNRIAGPNGQPGFRFTNGVIIAQIDGRLSVAEFEQSVQNYLNELVSSYWQLYLAYRNYEAAVRARETAYETWRVVEARYYAELEGGEADREAQAREQLLSFGQQVLVALSGDQRTGSPGVYQAEANLRRMIGLSSRDDQFIKPTDSPTEARTVYDWQHLTSRASERRAELRQQKLRVRQRELEMLASKNFLLPRLDAIATYRFNGFGDDLLGGGPGRFSDAFKDFYSGDHQESEFGLQFSVPIGFRREYAGYRNAQLTLQRERAILAEQHEQVYHELGNAVRQVSLDYRGLQNAYNRLVAANQAVEARLASFEADKIPLDFLLEAQERRAQAENAYHQTVVNYELSQIQVENQTGNLLNRFGVSFANVY